MANTSSYTTEEQLLVRMWAQKSHKSQTMAQVLTAFEQFN
jgi:hypothetical protein